MLDREQLAAASDEERDRALRSERQAATREAARVSRELALAGDATAASALRAAMLPLTRQELELETATPEGVVIND